MPDSMGRNSTGVDGKAPLISLMAVLSTTSIRAVWLLWLHAGAAYSAVEYARARVEVRRVSKFAQCQRVSLADIHGQRSWQQLVGCVA